ncbi:MAG: DoxX family protein [Betaproteobacteria bacterium]|jgi:putative oxidoreductase|nr:DoxX family protein [Betaproteobacteria bacterium]HMV20679.1 DoxX family protein [Rhodocyclaceae bacterium]HMW77276.1 DoxX family protein [Rhodocyclaceae bacterium]HNE41599.1 DoxX family protein [Rhodocyclaceae bacterium]HNL21555.1 DoxX family protein [Rhodocyclaceae bacterium]
MEVYASRFTVPEQEPPRAAALIETAISGLERLSPLVDLLIRIVVATVFFKSGLSKIDSWDTTLLLFENEYAVPFLPSEIAAYVGTAVELAMPVLLVLGLGTRAAAAVTFVFNIIAVLSYPDLGEAGLRDHQYWGIFLLVILLHGPGSLSIDHFIRRRLFGRKNA